MHVRSWQSAYRGLIAHEYLDGLQPEVMASRYTFGRRAFGLPSTVVAVDGSAICGLATMGLSRDGGDLSNFGELMALYVDPAYLRTVLGRLLITAARERLRGLVASALLWVLDGNARARRFHERDGWTFDGAWRTETFGRQRVRQVRYRCTLPNRHAGRPG